MKLLRSTLSSLALAMTATMILTASAQTAFSNEAFDSPARDIESEVAGERLKENWSDADVFGLRTFAEPLVADPKRPPKKNMQRF